MNLNYTQQAYETLSEVITEQCEIAKLQNKSRTIDYTYRNLRPNPHYKLLPEVHVDNIVEYDIPMKKMLSYPHPEVKNGTDYAKRVDREVHKSLLLCLATGLVISILYSVFAFFIGLPYLLLIGDGLIFSVTIIALIYETLVGSYFKKKEIPQMMRENDVVARKNQQILLENQKNEKENEMRRIKREKLEKVAKVRRQENEMAIREADQAADRELQEKKSKLKIKNDILQEEIRRKKSSNEALCKELGIQYTSNIERLKTIQKIMVMNGVSPHRAELYFEDRLSKEKAMQDRFHQLSKDTKVMIREFGSNLAKGQEKIINEVQEASQSVEKRMTEEMQALSTKMEEKIDRSQSRIICETSQNRKNDTKEMQSSLRGLTKQVGNMQRMIYYNK